jgi:hypothetical protein
MEFIHQWRGYSSIYPPGYSTTYEKATSQYTGQYVYNAFNPAKSLIGSYSGNCWMSSIGTVTNQRVNVDLGAPRRVDYIAMSNFHNSGMTTNAGIKNFTLQGSNEATAFDSTVYNTNTDWNDIYLGLNTQFPQHSASNVEDWWLQYVGISEYRYYSFKIADNWGNTSYMGCRRLELLQIY